MTEDEMVGWHHQLNGHESEYTLGVGDGQEGLVCCSPWVCKKSDMTERLNRTELTSSMVSLKSQRIPLSLQTSLLNVLINSHPTF